MHDFVSRDVFMAAARAGDKTPLALRKTVVVRAEGEEGSRKRRFTISDASVDRYGDTIAVEGWNLEAYRANPVVLWAHDARQFPIGKATEVGVDDGALKAVAEFAPADVPVAGDMAEGALRLLDGGFLSAVSVGFLPLRWEFVDDSERFGIDFVEQELLEFSVVSIPANPNALMEEGPPPSDPRGFVFDAAVAVLGRRARERTIAIERLR